MVYVVSKKIEFWKFSGWIKTFLFTLREIEKKEIHNQKLESQRGYRGSIKGKLAWKKYYSENKDKFLNYQKNYRLNNLDKIRETWRKTREKPKRKVYSKDYARQYLNSTNGRNIIKKHRRLRKARIREIREVFTQEQWILKVESTNGFCPSCNDFVGISKLTLDHILPVSRANKGQIYTIDDVQPLCFSCNASKYNHC